jgi:cullin-5
MKIPRMYFSESIFRELGLFSLLKAYIHEWSKFYEQCEYLPKPFVRIEATPTGNSSSNSDKPARNTDQVRQLMLESWNNNIFKDIKHRLQVKFY